MRHRLSPGATATRAAAGAGAGVVTAGIGGRAGAGVVRGDGRGLGGAGVVVVVVVVVVGAGPVVDGTTTILPSGPTSMATEPPVVDEDVLVAANACDAGAPIVNVNTSVCSTMRRSVGARNAPSAHAMQAIVVAATHAVRSTATHQHNTAAGSRSGGRPTWASSAPDAVSRANRT